MSIPTKCPVDNQRWVELVALIEFVSAQLEEIGNGTEDIRVRLVSGEHAGAKPAHNDDWFEGYLAALEDVVVFIEHRHSAGAAA